MGSLCRHKSRSRTSSDEYSSGHHVEQDDSQAFALSIAAICLLLNSSWKSNLRIKHSRNYDVQCYQHG